MGDPDLALWYLRKEIVVEPINPEDEYIGIGFCAKEQAWYGFGYTHCDFTVGSKITKNSVAYIPNDPQELIAEISDYYQDERYINIEYIVHPDCVEVTGKYRESFKLNLNSISDTHQKFSEKYPLGRGEWEAKTLADARQMAIDYSRE